MIIMKVKRIIAFVASLSIISTSTISFSAFADEIDADYVLVTEQINENTGYSIGQSAVYEKITESCLTFASDTTNQLSTKAFAVIDLEISLTQNEIEQVISDIKADGNYYVLDKIGIHSSNNDNSFDKIVLFTKDIYRNPTERKAVLTTMIITTQPTDYTGAIGETAKFTIGASGTGNTYQWQYSADGGKTWGASGQAGNKTTTLSMVIDTNKLGLKFRCIVTDASGKTYTSNVVAIVKK